MFARKVLISSIVVIVSLAGIEGVSAQMTAADAFNAGKSSGGTSNTQGMFDAVNSTKASEVVSGYSTTPPQSSYWNGNSTTLGNLLSEGSGKIDECASSGLSSSDPKIKQHCEAVNSIIKQNQTKPTNLIDRNDPIYLKGKVIANNPEAIAGVMNGAYSNCTTTTKQNDPEFVMETCDDWSVTGESACTMGQEVEVDPDYIYQCSETLSIINTGQCTVGTVVTVDADSNYQCNRGIKTYQTYTCNKIANVTVTPSTTTGPLNCTPGQLLAQKNNSYFSGGNGSDIAQVFCGGPGWVTLKWSVYTTRGALYYSRTANVATPSGQTYIGAESYCGKSVYATNNCNGTTCTTTFMIQGCYSAVSYGTTPAYYQPKTTTTTTYTANVTWTDQCGTLQARTQ